VEKQTEEEQRQFQQLLEFLNQTFKLEGDDPESEKDADRINRILRKVGVRCMGDTFLKGPKQMKLLLGGFFFEGLCQAIELSGLDWDFDLSWWKRPQ
jgi:hypothetical protein